MNVKSTNYTCAGTGTQSPWSSTIPTSSLLLSLLYVTPNRTRTMGNRQEPWEISETSELEAASLNKERLYKACRTCRRQKMRCDPGDGISCRRCLHTGVDCVFDKTTSRRRLSPAQSPAKRQKLQALTEEITALKAQVAKLNHSQRPVGPEHAEPLLLPQHQRPEQPNPIVTVSSSEPSADENHEIDVCHTFSPENLSVPVTAVHVMMHPPLHGEPERNHAGWTAENQSKWHHEEHVQTTRKDIIARREIDEPEARHLFDLYMNGANVFLPILDPILDTFDAIRERSSFTLAVILYVAARHQYGQNPGNPTLQRCKEEALRFAAQSLFENPSSLETTEAMTVLAAHSDKTWFAFGHAFQMASDLALESKFQSLLSYPSVPGNLPLSTKMTRFNLRCARTWLLIVQCERALAFGSLRESRTREPDLNELERFLNHPNSHPSDISSCATIELYQHLRRLRTHVELPTMEQFEGCIKTWFEKWDDLFEENGVHRESFQRSYLRIQELYARVIQEGMMFVHMLKSQPPSRHQLFASDGDAVNRSRRILHLIRELLTSVDHSGTYKKVFSWAPTYEGLLLTFVMILGFQVLLMHPDSGEMHALLIHVKQTVSLLEQHPCLRFYEVVQSLIHRATHSTAGFENPIHGNPMDIESILQGEDWMFDMTTEGFFDFTSAEAISDSTAPLP